MSLARANTSVFGYIGRRMALVNAAVLLLLIAVVGIGMVAVARYTMIQQAESSKTCSWSVEGAEDVEIDESDGGDITLRRV